MKRRLIALFAVLVSIMLLTTAVYAAPIVSWPGNQIAVGSNALNVIIAADGSAYVCVDGGGIYKYQSNGSLDTTWGTAGQAVPSMRVLGMCFDANGDILTGNGSGNSGVLRISAATGAVETLIPNVFVFGLATDTDGNIYVNDTQKLIKYDNTYTELWSKPLLHGYEIGLCLVPDGSMYTTYETMGTIQKYSDTGDLDTSFGTGGVLSLGVDLGLLSYDNDLYVGCYNNDVVKRISLDGTSVTDFISSPNAGIIRAVKDAYIISDLIGQKYVRYDRLYLDPADTQLACQMTPSAIEIGSVSPVSLNITSAIAAGYDVTAVVYDKANDLPVADITSTQATLTGGGASLTLTPSAAGWPAGNYYVELVFTNTLPGLTETDSMRVPTELAVLNLYTVTFKADGAPDMMKTVFEGATLADIPEVPLKTGMNGVWDMQDFTNIRDNMVVTAVYSVHTYTVEFKDWDGTIVDTQTVAYGQSAAAPQLPARSGYIFNGWDGNLNNVTDNRILNARYTAAPTPTAAPTATSAPTVTPTPAANTTVSKTGETGHTFEIGMTLLGLAVITAAVFVFKRTKKSQDEA